MFIKTILTERNSSFVCPVYLARQGSETVIPQLKESLLIMNERLVDEFHNAINVIIRCCTIVSLFLKI